MLILARGRFDQAQLEALAIEHGGRIEDYDRAAQRCSPIPATRRRAGDGHRVPRVRPRSPSAATTRSRSPSTPGAGSNMVSVNSEMMTPDRSNRRQQRLGGRPFRRHRRQRRQIPAEVRSHLPAITWFSAATHINGGVSGVFKAEARDEESAKNIRDIMNGFIALAKMQADSHARAATMVDTCSYGRRQEHRGIVHRPLRTLRRARTAQAARTGAVSTAHEVHDGPEFTKSDFSLELRKGFVSFVFFVDFVSAAV